MGRRNQQSVSVVVGCRLSEFAEDSGKQRRRFRGDSLHEAEEGISEH
jgi:hypothetical protein